MNLKFINTAINTLPLDPITLNYPRRISACYSLVNPTPITNPKLICYSEDALEMLDIKVNTCENIDIENYFSGNKIFNNSQPAAHCYSGYQFGIYAGQLGDGRAHYLGEIINKKGIHNELQLKGSGKTPFSRKGDGRAVLRSSIREFLCSEAMFYLGIPTTRAATIITSDTYVERDINYNGNITYEKVTVISRIAPTFIRVGSLQIADPGGPALDNPIIITKLLDYIIKYHYPKIYNQNIPFEKKIVEFIQELVLRTAKLVALWQAYGFVHGVLNTDNMSIIGITIDYGPFSFMERFDPKFTSNSSDKEGRYNFMNQPSVCKWNLQKLVESISLHFPNLQTDLYDVLNRYCEKYNDIFSDQIRLKFGLFKKISDDNRLIQLFLESLNKTKGDYTNIFRVLSEIGVNTNIYTILDKIINQTVGNTQDNRQIWIDWLNQYQKRLLLETDVALENRIKIMNSVNPKFIPRNSMIQLAIEKAELGDYSEVSKLLDLLKDPYDITGKYTYSNYDQVTNTKTSEKSLSCSS